MSRTMRLEVVTPGLLEIFDDVVRVRLEAADGARGVLAGHERARVCLAPGAIEVGFVDDHTLFIATEAGMAWIDGSVTRIISPWATTAAAFEPLQRAVRARAQRAARAEDEARAIARRHEAATKRAMVALRREVHS